MRYDVNERIKIIKGNEVVRDTEDWEICFVRLLGGGSGIGGTITHFAVRSLALKLFARMIFVGGGATFGVYGGTGYSDANKDARCAKVRWFSIKNSIREPFSLVNWGKAVGRVSVISLATPGIVVVGFTKIILSAHYNGERRQGPLFDKFHLDSADLGIGGIGAGVTLGKWTCLNMPDEWELDTDWTKPTCEAI